MSGSLAQIEDIFVRMRAEAGWDTAAPLLWGYFFVDADPMALERAAPQLAAAGYRLVDLFPLEDRELHMLHVERVEQHMPASLHARNAELHALAPQLGVSGYDGWDVGPAPVGA